MKHLKSDGYRLCCHTPNMWVHESRPKKCCLCVDNFGVKYLSEDDANNFIDTLKSAYEITLDKSGSN